MNNLAEMYRALGKTAEAAELHKAVLQKRSQILGPSIHTEYEDEQPRLNISDPREDGGSGGAS
jgi:hypothetical protein